jgi:hypothetical protein
MRAVVTKITSIPEESIKLNAPYLVLNFKELTHGGRKLDLRIDTGRSPVLLINSLVEWMENDPQVARLIKAVAHEHENRQRKGTKKSEARESKKQLNLF